MFYRAFGTKIITWFSYIYHTIDHFPKMSDFLKIMTGIPYSRIPYFRNSPEDKSGTQGNSNPMLEGWSESSLSSECSCPGGGSVPEGVLSMLIRVSSDLLLSSTGYFYCDISINGSGWKMLSSGDGFVCRQQVDFLFQIFLLLSKTRTRPWREWCCSCRLEGVLASWTLGTCEAFSWTSSLAATFLSSHILDKIFDITPYYFLNYYF